MKAQNSTKVRFEGKHILPVDGGRKRWRIFPSTLGTLEM